MKVIFVINPTAGSENHQKTVREIEEYSKEISLNYDIYKVLEEKKPNKLKSFILNNNADVVVACGGDGTINYVGSLLLGSKIKLAIIPIGSANGLAKALSIDLDIKKIIDSIVKGEIYEMDVLKINEKFNCLHLSSLGLNANLVKRYEDSNSSGMWGYAKHFIDAMKQAKPHKYSFHINGKVFKKRAEMITFANAKKYGTGAVINPEGEVDDGNFEVCIFKPFPWYALFRLSYHFFMGNLKNSPLVKIIKTKEATIVSDTKEILEVDGDIKGSFTEINVKIMRAALKLIR